MSKDVALITIRGMGTVKEKYFLKLEDKLRKSLGEDWGRISFQNIQYAHVLQKSQTKLWEDMTASSNDNELDWVELRKFCLFSFGDAGSLAYSAHRNTALYIAVQREIQKALRAAYLELGSDASKPVVLIAQSLGCQVISNYLWDATVGNKYIFEKTDSIEPNELEFLRLRSLRNLVTTGCNIPLFVSGLEKKDRVCFTPPPGEFTWDNYYDRDDILGWPLKQLGKTFDIVHDHEINAGHGFLSWNPASHLAYWSDKDVINPLARILKSHLKPTTS